MAGDGIIYVWDDEDFQALVARVIQSVRNTEPVMKAFSEYLVTRTDDCFAAEKSPSGEPWLPLAPATLARKAAMKPPAIDKILQQGGYLRLVHPVSGTDVAGVSSDRKYAAIHNRGGQAGRNRSVTIPRREFLAITEADLAEFAAVVHDWIVMGEHP